MELMITDYDTAKEILSGEHDFTHLISLPDNGHPLPLECSLNVYNRLLFQFDDITQPRKGYTLVSDADIIRIIDFAYEIQKIAQHQPVKLLCHCEAGISRSTAAAVIVQAVMMGAGDEDLAFEEVFRVRWVAHPNEVMIDIADRLLALDGRLSAARMRAVCLAATQLY